MMILMEPELSSNEIVDIFKPYLPMDLCLELTDYYAEMRYPKKYLLWANYYDELSTVLSSRLIGIYSNLNNALFEYCRCYYHTGGNLHEYDNKTNKWTYHYAKINRRFRKVSFESQLEIKGDREFHLIEETPSNFTKYKPNEDYGTNVYYFSDGEIRK